MCLFPTGTIDQNISNATSDDECECLAVVHVQLLYVYLYVYLCEGSSGLMVWVLDCLLRGP